ncbi:MAG: hypothetical protein NVSMB9_18440 [Isosphaeraceae bacterium]
MTQDGPSHLYNAHILALSFQANSPFRETFQVRWEPLPNWAGHLAMMGLQATLPPRVADRAMTSLTLIGLAGATTWLRLRVAGTRGMVTTALLSVVLGLNVAWLLGFSSFLLGASLFPITLGFWWRGRDKGFSWRRGGALAGFVVVGYFCHLVSLGLTTFGLVVLETATRGPRRPARALGTVIGLLPLLPLGLLYLGLARKGGGGGFAPLWRHLASPLSPRAWLTQLTWVDPITLARKDVVPLVDGIISPWCACLAPVFWLAAAFVLAILASLARKRDEVRLGWWVVGVLLLAAGVAGPDTLGVSHGDYLPQRVALLGLVALVPVLTLDASSWLGRATFLAVVGALILQSAFVWDYARTSERTAGAILRARQAVGTRQRIATLLIGTRTRFRANPLLHADCALGVGTGNILWSDYETRFYYFPVRFRLTTDQRPDPAELEEIALSDAPHLAPDRARRWSRLLERHHRSIDVLLVWGADPVLDALNARYFSTTFVGRSVRVLQRTP